MTESYSTGIPSFAAPSSAPAVMPGSYHLDPSGCLQKNETDGYIYYQVGTQYQSTLLPSDNTVALGMFCDAKYTSHIHANRKTVSSYNNSEHWGKNSFVGKYVRNPTNIKLDIPLQNYLCARSTS